MSEETPRVMTRRECKKAFYEQLQVIVSYWLHESRTPDTVGKLNGLVFSILVLLDGGSVLPEFMVIPDPHPDDAEDRRKSGRNWWPDYVDIAGDLHNNWHEYEVKSN